MQEKEEHILNMAEAVFEGAFLANTYYQIISEIQKHQKQYQTQLDEYSGFFVYAYTAMIYAMAMETSKLFDKNVQAISVQKLQNQFYNVLKKQ